MISRKDKEKWLNFTPRSLGAISFRKRGFTLVEMLIYVSFLAVFSVLVINAVIITTKAFADFRLTRDINNSAVTVMERLVRDIRTAHDVDQIESDFSSHPGRLMLETMDDVGADTTVEFYVDSGRIRVKEGGVDTGFLSSQNVTVDILVFDFVTNINTSAVTIRLQLSSSRGSSEKQKTFYSTVILRGSY